MDQYGIEWEQKGTHEKHLSVYDYEKKMRAEEVKILEKESGKLQTKVDELNSKISISKNTRMRLKNFQMYFMKKMSINYPILHL